jgi:hypothetical protein
VDKAVAQAHSTALREAMEYLAQHAGYTRVHNPATGAKDLTRLPVWWRRPTSTRPAAPAIRIYIPTSSSPTGKPAPTAPRYRSTARRCITKPAPPESSTKPRCAANYTAHPHPRPLIQRRTLKQSAEGRPTSRGVDDVGSRRHFVNRSPR